MLNPIEHLLVCLNEEGVEVAKDADKSLRFGLDDHNVLNPTGPSNRERLVSELNDFMAVVSLCVQVGIIPLEWQDDEKQAAKCVKVRTFMDYAVGVGTLRPKSEQDAQLARI